MFKSQFLTKQKTFTVDKLAVEPGWLGPKNDDIYAKYLDNAFFMMK